MIAYVSRKLGSWKCGKGRTFPTFPQALYFFIKTKFTNKVIIKGGGEQSYSSTLASEALFDASL